MPLMPIIACCSKAHYVERHIIGYSPLYDSCTFEPTKCTTPRLKIFSTYKSIATSILFTTINYYVMWKNLPKLPMVLWIASTHYDYSDNIG